MEAKEVLALGAQGFFLIFSAFNDFFTSNLGAETFVLGSAYLVICHEPLEFQIVIFIKDGLKLNRSYVLGTFIIRALYSVYLTTLSNHVF